MIKLSPSLLAADALHLGDAAQLAVEVNADELHFDVMDGQFVPNLTFGPHILKAIKKAYPTLYADVHLMLARPALMIDSFASAGADGITVHAEAEDWWQCIFRIHELGLKAGVSLRPKTDLSVLQPLYDEIDRVLLMTVEPGFGGQKLMPEVLDKARQLREIGFKGEIEADGGISPQNMQMLADAGIGVLVMGTAFFKAEDPKSVAQGVHALQVKY